MLPALIRRYSASFLDTVRSQDYINATHQRLAECMYGAVCDSMRTGCPLYQLAVCRRRLSLILFLRFRVMNSLWHRLLIVRLFRIVLLTRLFVSRGSNRLTLQCLLEFRNCLAKLGEIAKVCCTRPTRVCRKSMVLVILNMICSRV